MKKKRLGLAALMLACCLPLQSCFTTALLHSGTCHRGTAALLPLTLTVDLITLPFQIDLLTGGRHSHCH